MDPLGKVDRNETWSCSIAGFLADETDSRQVFFGDVIEDLNENFGW